MNDHSNEPHMTAEDWAAYHASQAQHHDDGDGIRQSVAREVVKDLLKLLNHKFFWPDHQPARQSGREREPSSTRRDAYLWIVDRVVRRAGVTSGYRFSKDFILPIGEAEFSQAWSEMAAAWNWSDWAVRIFLEGLEAMGELKRIHPVNSSGVRLRMQRVPTAYEVSRVAGWYSSAHEGIQDGVTNTRKAELEASRALEDWRRSAGSSPRVPVDVPLVTVVKPDGLERRAYRLSAPTAIPVAPKKRGRPRKPGGR
ncbi:MAG: hypothetical protein B7Y80_12955 [Hyphomicrobium sp. 32-62-53]|nr:MAG: hypothetical protein B7Y80_12955 [Hyphomicrobium sp. 32-62-53]